MHRIHTTSTVSPLFPRSCALAAFLLISCLNPYPCHGAPAQIFYTPRPYGSEAFYNPFNLTFAYALDTVQLNGNFDTENMDERWGKVRHDLTHPFDAMDEEGGTRAFINRQIFPLKGEDTNERYAIIPNYFLHLFGGGMVYRKDAEYFQANHWPAPRLCAAAIGMISEIVQETVEKKSTTSDDEVADVLLFRPIGMLLFSSDTVAEFVATRLSPSIWPHLLIYDVKEKTFVNTGINYVIRPKAWGNDSVRFFSFIGMNNLIGLSHVVDQEDSLSWAIGLATTKVDLSRDIPAEFRVSSGLFYDRNDSLLWSVIINGTENLRVRLNVYPMESPPFRSVGFFAGLSDDNALSLGVSFNFPVGVGGSF